MSNAPDDIRVRNAEAIEARVRQTWPQAVVDVGAFDPTKTRDIEVTAGRVWFAFALKPGGDIGVSVDARTQAEVDAEPLRGYGTEADAWFGSVDDAVRFVADRVRPALTTRRTA